MQVPTKSQGVNPRGPITASDVTRESTVVEAIFEADTVALPPNLNKVLHLPPNAFNDPSFGQIIAAILKVRNEGQDPVNAVTVGRLLHADQQIRLALVIEGKNSVPLEIAELEAENLLASMQARGVKVPDLVKVQSSGSSDAAEYQNYFTSLGYPLERAQKSAQAIVEFERWEPLLEREFNPLNPPPVAVPRFYLRGIPVCTEGNITVLSGPPKQAKSSTIGAMLASVMADDDAEVDCLGFISSNPQNHAVIHIDTEQSKRDHWELMMRSLRRAGVKDPPPWLLSFCVTGWSFREIWDRIAQLTAYSVHTHGGLHSLFIDGVADMIADVNDAAEANGFVAKLHGHAITYACPIIGAIHLNPGSDTKTRGHLGSQLERKAETNLKLESDKHNGVIIWSDKNRRANIAKENAPRIVWSEDLKMHVTGVALKPSKDTALRKRCADLAESVFADRPSMRRNDLEDAIVHRLKVGESTAYRRAKEMIECGVIKQAELGLYVIIKAPTP